MIRLLAAGLVFALSAGFAPADDKDKPTAEKFVGLWKLVKSSEDLPKGLEATLEATKDGKFVMKVTFDDNKLEMTGTWKLNGNKLTVEYADGPEKGKKETMEITKLTDDEFATLDEKKKKDEFKRVKK